MSYRDALYYACTGETFNGKEAAAMRLVNFSVPRAELKAATLKFAHLLLTEESGSDPLHQGMHSRRAPAWMWPRRPTI